MAKKTTTTTRPQTAAAQYAAGNPTTGTAGVGSPPTYQQTSNVPQPLGVPVGYSTGIPDEIANNLGDIGGARIQPLYYAGSQWGQVQDFPTDSSGIIQLQQMLMQAGFLNPKSVIVGQWDASSAGAFAQVLASANQRGTDWKTALARSLSTADQTAALNATAKKAEVTTLTNPDDIKAAAQSAARSLSGGDLTPDELNHFITSYQGMQSAAHHAAFVAGDPTATGDYSGTAIAPGGTVTAAPSLSVAADAEIKKQHPDQVFVSALGAALKNVTNTIGTPGGGFM